MTQNNKWLIMGIFFLSAAVLLSGLFIGLSVNKEIENGPMMTLEQVSKYINLTTEEITNIIIWENAHPEYFGDAYIKFPYYEVGHKKYFNENDIALWLHNVSTRVTMNRFISLSSGWREY